MAASTDVLAFASQILAFLGFSATCFALIRYLNPGPEYIALADLVAQVRRSWTKYENEGLPVDDYTISFLSTLERLESEVRELLFVVNKKNVKCQLRAWTNALRIKKLSDRAQLLRIGLPLIVQVNREIYNARKNPAFLEGDIIALEKKSRLRVEFIRLLEENVNPNMVLQIPPVAWTPSLEDLPLRRIGTPRVRSVESTDTLFEPVTPPPETVELSPDSPLQAANAKKRGILKKILLGVRRKRNSYDSERSCSV